VVKRTIADVLDLRADLNAPERELFDRLYRASKGSGRLVIPDLMTSWVEDRYGSVDEVTSQDVVKITNLWTLQTSLFNPFRSRRPQKGDDSMSLADEIYGDGPDPFDYPERETSEDVFGRVRGEHCITASNLAKSDACHGVIIFDEHNPWMVTADALWDAVQVATRWFSSCRAERPDAIYPMIIWNCLWKSGASINHAHMQLLLTDGTHYGGIEGVRRTASSYASVHESSYFEDLYRVHAALGLGREGRDVRVLAHLTPLLANECIILADGLTEQFVRTVHRAIRALNEELDVTSFNLVLVPHPLAETSEDWSMMPVTARIVDRGDPLRRTVDIGALELFAASVISSDPLELGVLLGRILEA
jgi:hypothetical protein